MHSSYDQASLLVLARRIALRWRPAAGVFCLSFLLISAITLLLPSKYESHLKVVVKNERVDPLIGADKQTQGILYVNEISEPRMNTEIQLLLSEDVLREVVQNSHLADTSGKTVQPTLKREEAAMRRLQKDLVVNAIRNSNVIEATYESRNPQLAADVLHNLAQAYMHSHRMVHGVPGSYEFFKDVSAKYTGELATAEAEMASFAKTHHIVTMPEQKTLALANISHLRGQMQESAAAAEKDRQAAVQLKKEIAALPEVVNRGRKTMPNQAAIEQLSTVLVGLENKRAQAAYRYQPDDRIVRELDTQIQQTQAAIIDARTSSAEEVSTGANPALDYARSEYVRSDVEEAGDRARMQELSRQMNRDNADLVQLDAQSVAYRSLLRKVTDLEELDQSYRKRAEEARLADMLDEQRISNLAFIEEPFQSQIPSSPKRGLILAVGFLWSLLLASATAIGLEFVTERVQTTFALEQATHVPVLATVPAHAVAPSFSGSFPALYLAMQRPHSTLEGRLS